MILSCNHIRKAFGTNQILSEVSFHIEDHEKAAIVGINGAGKSTLLKIIVGELAAAGKHWVIWLSTKIWTAPAPSMRSCAKSSVPSLRWNSRSAPWSCR